MEKQTVVYALTLYILTSLQGCATRPPTAEPGMPGAENIPGANPALDHYTAWVPRDRAQTPSVAMAITHISMGYAKEQASRKLCGDNWLMHESITERAGPVAVIAPETMGGYPAWYYRVSLQPGLLGCERISSPRLYRAIQDNLPEWIRLEPAVNISNGTATLFR